MAVYAADRLTVYYTGPLGSHRMHFWKVNGALWADFYDQVRAVVGDIVDIQYEDTVWHTAERQDAGNNFSTPVAWPPITSVLAANPTGADTVGEYLNLVGRSTSTGRRARLYIFEQVFGPSTSMRLANGSNLQIDQLIDNLNNQGNAIGAIDGSAVTWKNYANLGINDYWTRQARTGV